MGNEKETIIFLERKIKSFKILSWILMAWLILITLYIARPIDSLSIEKTKGFHQRLFLGISGQDQVASIQAGLKNMASLNSEKDWAQVVCKSWDKSNTFHPEASMFAGKNYVASRVSGGDKEFSVSADRDGVFTVSLSNKKKDNKFTISLTDDGIFFELRNNKTEKRFNVDKLFEILK